MENTSEQAAEVLLEVLIGASSGESYPGRVVDLDLAEWADGLDILIPALESHRDCARQGL